jgi:twitching motility protein PilT
MATHAVKNFIRNREFFKIANSLETGAEHGMYTFQRYRNWLDNRSKWSIPDQNQEAPDSEVSETRPSPPVLPSFLSTPQVRPEKNPTAATRAPAKPSSTRIEIEPTEGEFGKILKRPGE